MYNTVLNHVSLQNKYPNALSLETYMYYHLFLGFGQFDFTKKDSQGS